MRKIFFIIIAIITVNKIVAQPQDAIYNLIKKQYVINEDESVDYTVRKELKLISLRSFFNIYGESFILYNPNFQSLKINEAYTIRKDGSKVQTPLNAFVEQLPFSCVNCSRYSNMKEMVVVHTALEYDATIVLDYTIHSKTNIFMEEIDFVEDAPISVYEVSIKLPEDKKLYYEMINSSIKPIINNHTYTWILKNLHQSSAEYYLPAKEVLYPILYLSTDKNIKYKFPTQLSQLTEADNVLKELTGSENALENVINIRNYVVDNIFYNNVPIRYNNYRFTTAQEVWNSNCGNAHEKAILLKTLLNQAGFEANENYIIHSHLCEKDSFFIFDESNATVTVTVNDTKYNISPTYKNNLKLDGAKNVDTKIKLHCSAFTWNNEKLIGEIIVGELLFNNKPIVETLINNNTVTRLFKNASLKITGNNPSSFALCEIEILPKKITEKYFSITLPETTVGLNINPSYLVKKRENLIQCGKTNEEYLYSVILPDSIRFVGKEVVIRYEKPFGKINIEIRKNNNRLEVSRQLIINQERIPIKEYPAFRQMMVDWTNEHYKTLTFKIDK